MKKFDRIYIEISNVCNLQCSFCPEVLRPKKVMSSKQFEIVITKIKPHAKAVTLHVMGEPLAHPQFSEFLSILDHHELPLILTSNGTLLDRHREALLSSSSIKQINFSIHSFFDNYPEKSIGNYLSNLSKFAQQFTEKHSEAFINFRLWNLSVPTGGMTANNKKIYAEFENLFASPELPLEVSVTRQKSFRLARHIKLHFDTEFEWPSLNSTHSPHHGFCYGLKNQLAILTEGSVVPCCLDKEAVINLGSIFENSLENILQQPRALDILRGFGRNQAVEPLCQKCQYKVRFANDSV
jgi:radical SAM protein with 4Fe4S-binding SPASM domain